MFFWRRTTGKAPLTREDLAERVVRRLRRHGIRDARFDPGSFAVQYEGAVLYLENLYVEICAAPVPQQRARVKAFVDALIRLPATPDDWDRARTMLRPVLRGAAPMAVDHSAPITRPALPFLAELLVIDLPASMAYVTADHLRTWGVSADEAYAAARSNLRAGAVAPPKPGESLPTILHFVDEGDSYCASFPLVDGWLAGLAARLGGKRPVAFLPDRTTVVVTTDDPDTLLATFPLVEAEFLESARSTSPMAYVSDDLGRTVPYEAPPGHPLHHAVRRAERLLALREYDRQHRTADGLPGTPLPLRMAQRPDGSTFTYALWSGESPALMPVADLVAIADGDGGTFFVPWAELALRDLFTPLDGLTPPRHLASAFPDEATRTELKGCEIQP
ncbi:hypothetical protein [Catenuloplanes atrovinosus]|uniref:DUF1444 domain-containing protein n=1 Tax=Catenuloplanes atrovinosus TaxID=137266 RepID=A0AAE3YTZ9_9ACTN|nr:hypothetical protein [Catenuloplanes atrovinosus]MDR7278626.1 hypothetical protein [Catenuloplanes atrovinosus]